MSSDECGSQGFRGLAMNMGLKDVDDDFTVVVSESRALDRCLHALALRG